MISPDWAMMAEYLETRIGYVVSPAKHYLLEKNVGKLMKEAGVTTVPRLINQCDTNRQLMQKLTNSVTINESFFFREPTIWKDISDRVFTELIPELQFKKKIDILLCACSTGQELYTIKMILEQNASKLNGYPVHITATDIDTDCLAYAKQGAYSDIEIGRGLTDDLKRQYFRPVGDRFQVSDSLKQNIEFKPINLVDNFFFARRYDLIFCRNVLIYFSKEQKQMILQRLSKWCNGYGFLCIGGCETLLGCDQHWASRRLGSSSFYQKRF